MKLGYLRPRYGERVTTFASATPIANSLSEMWVTQNSAGECVPPRPV